MPQVVNGGDGNLGSNPSGVGAVIFDSTLDPLTVHYKNLDMLDQAADRRKAEAAVHLKGLADMAAANNPDENGIRPYDAPRLKEDGLAVENAYTDFLKAGGHLNTQQGIEAHSKYQQALNTLTQHIALSKDANSKLSSVYNTVAADKGDKLDLETSNALYGKAMATPLEGLQSLNWQKLIVPNKDTDISGAMAEWAKELPTNETTTTGVVNGFESSTSTKTKVTDADVDQFSNQWRGTKFKDIIDNSWDEQPDTVKSTYVKQAKDITGDATLALPKAIDLYAKDWAKKQQMKMQTVAIHGETEKSKVAAKKGSGEYAEWPHMIASVATGDPAVMGMMSYSPPLTQTETIKGQQTPRKAEVYGTTVLNTLALGKTPVQVPKYDKDGKPIRDANGAIDYAISEVPNHPTVAYLDVNNKIQMATVESEENYRKGLQETPYVGTGFKSMKDALYYIGSTIPKSGKEEGLDPLTSMMAEIERVGAKKKNGDIDEYVLNPMDKNKMAERARKAAGHVKYQTLAVSVEQPDGGEADALRAKYKY